MRTFYEECQILESPNLAVQTAKLENGTQNSFVETNNKTNLAVPTAKMQGKDEIRQPGCQEQSVKVNAFYHVVTLVECRPVQTWPRLIVLQESAA